MDIAMGTEKANGFVPAEGGKPEFPWLWIGTWSMGGMHYGGADLRISQRTIEMAYDLGIRHFDTAGLYAKGLSETLLQMSLGHMRRRIFISTKGGLIWKGNSVVHRAGGRALEMQLHESLKRLKTDYIDLFLLHWPDPRVDIQESLDALKSLQEKGIIRHFGAGNLSCKEISRYIPENSYMPLQTAFNPLRMDNLAVLEAGAQKGRAINMIVSPFEQGLLVDARFLERPPGKKDVRSRNPLFKCSRIKMLLKEFFHLIGDIGLSPAGFILAWILGFEQVDVLIPGPRTPAQLEGVLEHVKWIEGKGRQRKSLHQELRGEVGEDILAVIRELGRTAQTCMEAR